MSDAPSMLERGPAREDTGRRVPVMRSAAHRLHAAMGGVFEARARWEVPALYGTEKDERAALDSGLGYADVSARGKVPLSGAVAPLLRSLAGATVEPLHSAPLQKGGLAARLARDWAMALVGPSEEARVLKDLEGAAVDAMATDVTSAMSAFFIAGPRLAEFFARSLTMDPAELSAGRCAAAAWSRIPAVLMMREQAGPAVELYVSSDHGRYAWETICRLGDHLHGAPVGWRALETWGWK